VRVSGVDEDPVPGESPREMAMRLACNKACDVSRAVEAFTLGADTVVVVDGAVLGKPRDDADAARMLCALAGRTHSVITGVALARRGGVVEALAVETRVEFAPLDEARVGRYVASGEGRDKAGAYAVQGLAAAFITRIEGSYSGIMGLPLAETAELLRSYGISIP